MARTTAPGAPRHLMYANLRASVATGVVSDRDECAEPHAVDMGCAGAACGWDARGSRDRGAARSGGSCGGTGLSSAAPTAGGGDAALHYTNSGHARAPLRGRDHLHDGNGGGAHARSIAPIQWREDGAAGAGGRSSGGKGGNGSDAVRPGMPGLGPKVPRLEVPQHQLPPRSRAAATEAGVHSAPYRIAEDEQGALAPSRGSVGRGALHASIDSCTQRQAEPGHAPQTKTCSGSNLDESSWRAFGNWRSRNDFHRRRQNDHSPEHSRDCERHCNLPSRSSNGSGARKRQRSSGSDSDGGGSGGGGSSQ